MLSAKRNKSGVALDKAVSTSCTLLNLACTDTQHAGYHPGGYFYLVGDSSSGKTFLTHGCLAEASLNPLFDRYRLIYDDVENGALMDISQFFGKKLAARLEPPRRSKKGRPINSETVEDFYFNIQDAIDQKKPFIYVLDSQDALVSKASQGKFLEQKKASEAGRDAAGSYGDGKAKYHSEHLRQVVGQLRKTGSILLIIGQTRDNLGFGFEKKTRSGGKALRFYANVEIWTSVVGKIKKKVNGRERTIGVECLAEVRKNRVTGKIGKDRAVTFPILYAVGIDDIGACVDFLIFEKHWDKVGKGIYDAKEFLVQGSRDKIVDAVEEEGLESKLREITAQVWQRIEQECTPDRKKRYE